MTVRNGNFQQLFYFFYPIEESAPVNMQIFCRFCSIPDRPAAFLQNPYGMFCHNPVAGKYDNGFQLPAPGNYIWKTDIPAGHRCCKTVSDPVPAGPTAPGCGVPDGRKSGFSGYLQRADLS